MSSLSQSVFDLIDMVLPEVVFSAVKAEKGNSCFCDEALNSLHSDDKKIKYADNLVVGMIIIIMILYFAHAV